MRVDDALVEVEIAVRCGNVRVARVVAPFEDGGIAREWVGRALGACVTWDWSGCAATKRECVVVRGCATGD